MPSPCKLCSYHDRYQIERDIATGALSTRNAAKLVGINYSSVQRHMKNHAKPMMQKVTEIAEKLELKETLNVVSALNESHERVIKLFNESIKDGDRRAALLAIEAETRQLSLIAKVTGQTNTRAPQVNFLINPTFVKLKNLMVTKLMPFPEARLALSEAFDELRQDQEAIDEKERKTEEFIYDIANSENK